jgi:hypothetical protein
MISKSSPMNPRLRIPLIVVSVLLAIGGYFYTQVDWDARAIRQQLNRLVESVEKDAPASTFEALGRSRQLVDTLAPGASIEYLPGRSLPKDLDAMSGAFVSAWGRADRISILVLRHEVSVEPDEPRAESMLTARCSVILEGSERAGDTLKYRIYWHKIEGEWRIETLIPTG